MRAVRRICATVVQKECAIASRAAYECRKRVARCNAQMEAEGGTARQNKRRHQSGKPRHASAQRVAIQRSHDAQNVNDFAQK